MKMLDEIEENAAYRLSVEKLAPMDDFRQEVIAHVMIPIKEMLHCTKLPLRFL